MKFGICTGNPAQWPIAAALGYDFIEGNFSLLATATEEEFASIRRIREESGIPVASYNCFFPGTFSLYAYDPITGLASDAFAQVEESLRRYVTVGMARAAALGGQIAVIGSSGARSIPADLPRRLAEAQFSRVLTICADIAAAHGMQISVEPLNPRETNFINTLSDSLALVSAIGHPNLRVMVDFYHERLQVSSPEESILRAGDLLAHVHLCRSDRDLPHEGDGAGDLLPCLAPLRAIGYDGRISLEGHVWGNFETCGAIALRELRILFG